jgi:predicted GIY-YIG superfamily endonuclease
MIKTLSFILLKEFYHYYFKTLTIQLLFLMKYHKIIDKTLANVIDDLFEDPEIIDEQTCRWCKKTYFNKDIPDNFKVLKHIYKGPSFKYYESCNICYDELQKILKTYVLHLENNKYYIGITLNLQKRFDEHLNKKERCANWTRKYKPITIIETFDGDIERELTLKYMNDYGIENVRGSVWCKVNLKQKSINKIKKILQRNYKTLFIEELFDEVSLNQFYDSRTIYI